MKQIRIILWVLLAMAFAAFLAMNTKVASVNFWPMGTGYLHFEWPVGFIALVFFLIGFLPTWATGQWRRWRFKRRISSLESSLTSQPNASLSSTQLDAAATATNETP